jgi:transcriptional regulator with XRE-family HTH domain
VQDNPGELFGRRLREEREQRGWTQAELAERSGTGLHPTAVTRIERSERGVSLNEALAFAAALGVSLPELTNVAERSVDARVVELSERVTAIDERIRDLQYERVLAVDELQTLHLSHPRIAPFARGTFARRLADGKA